MDLTKTPRMANTSDRHGSTGVYFSGVPVHADTTGPSVELGEPNRGTPEYGKAVRGINKYEKSKSLKDLKSVILSFWTFCC